MRPTVGRIVHFHHREGLLDMATARVVTEKTRACPGTFWQFLPPRKNGAHEELWCFDSRLCLGLVRGTREALIEYLRRSCR